MDFKLGHYRARVSDFDSMDSLIDPFWHLAEYPVEHIVCQVHGLLDCRSRRHHPHVYLPLPRQSQPCNDASTQVHERSIHPWHPCIRIEHGQPSACATACLGRRLKVGSVADHRTADTSQQSRFPAWFQPGQGRSRRIPCNGQRSRRARVGAGSTPKQYRGI